MLLLVANEFLLVEFTTSNDERTLILVVGTLGKFECPDDVGSIVRQIATCFRIICVFVSKIFI